MDSISDISHPGWPGRDWVRLRTLIYLRWLAIAGQTAALVAAVYLLGIEVRVDLCALLVGLSAAFNLAVTVIYPENKRLRQRDAALTLLFDLGQLGLLLYLTGGLTNPFAVLILAQSTIGATVLGLGSALVLGWVTLSVIGFLAVFHVPLRMADGAVLEIPGILTFGMWAALSISVVFLGLFARRVSLETHSMSDALTATRLALEQEHKLTALGGVVAAAAHELGTPLATIKLAASELADELEELTDRPDLIEDAQLIREQADRCRRILASMGQRGKDDLLVRMAPFSAVVEEAAEPHRNRGKRILLRGRGGEAPQDFAGQPDISRRAEVIHGLRNLVQNAVDFAATTVWIDMDWTEDRLLLRVSDDGRGFPVDLIGRIGDPFVRRRTAVQQADPDRPGYKGMGLGLFIAKTLLERTGARLTFANGIATGAPGPEPSGAVVEVAWSRADLEVSRAQSRAALGENRPLTG